MAEYRLYCFAESGNSYKPALMLALSGCDWESRWVDYFNGETRGEVYRSTINELGEAPVLEHGGKRLTQSGVILTYLAERTGRFGGRNADERLEVLRWLLFDNHKFTSYFATLRFLVGLQKTGETPVTEFLRTRALAAFGIVEKHLAAHPFMTGDAPTIADISMAGYLYYPEETGIDRKAFPNIEAWTKRIAALPGWKHPYDLMPRGPAK
jgi:glutathione S-transferase